MKSRHVDANIKQQDNATILGHKPDTNTFDKTILRHQSLGWPVRSKRTVCANAVDDAGDAMTPFAGDDDVDVDDRARDAATVSVVC